jgi:hypothetical protein
MPNDLSNLMNTVAYRFTDLTAYLKPHAAFLSAVTINPVPPEFKQVNDVVKLNQLAVDGDVVDHQSSTITTANLSTTPTNIQLTKTPTKTFKIGTYEASRLADSPGLLDESFSIVITQFLEHINGILAGLFTTTNFNTTGNIPGTGTGATADALSHADATALWSTLATRKIPVTDTGNVFLITHPYIYGKMLDDADYTKATSIGDQYASQMRTTGSLMPINGMYPIFDSQAPTSGSGASIAYTSAAFHRRAVVAQFATPEPPMNGLAYRYANVFGIPLLIVPNYDTNLGSTGGAFNSFTVSALWNAIVFRKDHCVLHTTPGA